MNDSLKLVPTKGLLNVDLWVQTVSAIRKLMVTSHIKSVPAQPEVGVRLDDIRVER
jgi:hypothetical protein